MWGIIPIRYFWRFYDLVSGKIHEERDVIVVHAEYQFYN
jgi:hypothetical protein